ncbi:hypothetical protein LINPERHAP1_LOCUS29519 [Linum perenne]
MHSGMLYMPQTKFNLKQQHVRWKSYIPRERTRMYMMIS